MTGPNATVGTVFPDPGNAAIGVINPESTTGPQWCDLVTNRAGDRGLDIMAQSHSVLETEKMAPLIRPNPEQVLRRYRADPSGSRIQQFPNLTALSVGINIIQNTEYRIYFSYVHTCNALQ